MNKFETIKAARNVDGGINLDRLTAEFLTDIADAIDHNAAWAAELIWYGLVPGGDRKACIEATETLGRYARYKAAALRLRAAGTEVPELTETACGALYDQLPEWAQWGK